MHKSEKWKWSHSVSSNSQRPHGLQPTRLLHPWDVPGKSAGVGCHCLLQWTEWWPPKIHVHTLTPRTYECIAIVVQLLSLVQLFATPWTTACQAPLSSTVSQSLLKSMSTESVMQSSRLLLCHPFSFCFQSFPASESFPVSWLLHQVAKVLIRSYWEQKNLCRCNYVKVLEMRKSWIIWLFLKSSDVSLLETEEKHREGRRTRRRECHMII